MAYGATYPALMEVVRKYAPLRAEALVASHRWVDAGLLPVGIKAHCLDEGKQFDPIIDELGGRQFVVDQNLYKQSAASFCLVLPPVGSAHAAVYLLETLEIITNSKIFDNPKIQIQVCTAGVLDSRSSSILGVCFYLGTDTLKRYNPGEFQTTFSTHYQHPRGRRLVIRDAGGDFDPEFECWIAGADGSRITTSNLMKDISYRRTDILTCQTAKDIRNVNLVATLLIHRRWGGYWKTLGEMLVRDVEALLNKHCLIHVLDAPWIKGEESQGWEDNRFMDVLKEVTTAAWEALNLLRKGHFYEKGNLLCDFQTLISDYRTTLTKHAAELQHGEQT